MTTALHVKVDSIWNRRDATTGRVEVLESTIFSGEHWVRVRHLDMPAQKTKTWWSLERRFVKKYEPADI